LITTIENYTIGQNQALFFEHVH